MICVSVDLTAATSNYLSGNRAGHTIAALTTGLNIFTELILAQTDVHLSDFHLPNFKISSSARPLKDIQQNQRTGVSEAECEAVTVFSMLRALIE
jgi:hypothetical protein